MEIGFVSRSVGAGLIGCIAFRQGDRVAEAAGVLDVVGTLRVDTYRGEDRLEMRVTDFRRAS